MTPGRGGPGIWLKRRVTKVENPAARRAFSGLSAFPLTPADENGRVDTTLLAKLVDRLCEAKVASIGALGSTGAYVYLSKAERGRAARAAIEAAAGRVPVVIGVGAFRTDDAVAYAREAEALGADAVLLAPVSYAPLTDEEAFRHYEAVASATALPLCIYNNPTATHFTFKPTLLSRLAGVANIAAVKMPLPAGGDFKAELAALREETDLLVGYSGDWGMADALLSGADAFYSVVGGILPRATLLLTSAAQRGDEAEARRVDALFQPLWETFKAYGSLRVMYVLLEELSLGRAAPPRPILPLGSAERERVAAAFEPLRAIETAGGSRPNAVRTLATRREIGQ